MAKTLKDLLLEEEFGEHVDAIKSKSVYVASGCGSDIEVNTDIDTVLVNFFEKFLPKQSFFGRLFKTYRESQPYTKQELATKLVEIGYADNVQTAQEYLPELVKLRAAGFMSGKGGFCFAMKVDKGEPTYKVRGNVRLD